MIDPDYMAKVKEAHKRFGFSFTTRVRGDKQYVTLGFDARKAKVTYSGHGWHGPIHRHIRLIFPGAQVTSGGFGGLSFDITVRTNP